MKKNSLACDSLCGHVSIYILFLTLRWWKGVESMALDSHT